MDVRGERRLYCRYCGEEILMIHMAKGTTMPVDREPVHYTPGGGPDRFITLDGHTVFGRERRNGSECAFKPHFKTCKNSEDRYRDGGGKKGRKR